MIRYIVQNRNFQIPKIIKENQIICVSGGYFGDEAKGKTVADLSDFVEGVARVNSGENAGHTVHMNDKECVFHLIPSGIQTGKPTFIGDNCVMDPINFFHKEIEQLIKNGINYSNLTIGNTFVVMPWHKITDLMRNPNASTGKGMSQIHQEIAAKKALRLEDFLNDEEFLKIKKSYQEWEQILFHKFGGHQNIIRALQRNKIELPEHLRRFLEKENEVGLREIYETIKNTITAEEFPKIGNPRKEMTEILNKGGRILLEGPQSFYLSNIEGTHFSSSTSAQTHPTGILAASGLSPAFETVTINVLKIPSSRVGLGANPSGYVEQDWFSKRNLKKDDLIELSNKLQINFFETYRNFCEAIKSDLDPTQLPYRSSKEWIKNYSFEDRELMLNEALAIASCLHFKEFGTTTGKPRICGSLDLPHLHHMVKYQNKKVTFSCIDRFDGLESIIVVKGYEYVSENTRISNGEVYKFGDKIMVGDELPSEGVLKNCKPIYEVLDGWKTSNGTSHGDEIDQNLGKFFNYVETSTNCRIISFGNGPKTKDMVYIKKVD